MIRRPARLDPVLIVPGIVGAGLVAGWLGLQAGADRAVVVADVGLAWAAAAVAMTMWLARHDRGAAGWLALAAFLLLVPYLGFAASSIAWTAAFVLGGAWAAAIVHFVLAFPEGRLGDRPTRVLVGSAYVAAIGGQLLAAPFVDDPRNLLLGTPNLAALTAVWTIVAAAVLVITVGFVLMVGARIVRLRGAQRRLSGPLLLGALLAAQPALVRYSLRLVGNVAAFDALEPLDRFSTLLVPAGALVGVLWSHARRAAASALVIDLRDGTRSFRDRLADALGDPTLEIGYWAPATSEYLDADGAQLDVTNPDGRAVTRLIAGGTDVAALVHDPALLDDRDLLEAVAATAGLVLENDQLGAEVAAQLDEVRASRTRILAAADDERRRLERDLHDGAQQQLVALGLKLQIVERHAGPDAIGPLAEVRHDLEVAIEDLRELARGVHPTLLADAGVDAAVEALTRRLPIPVDIDGSTGTRLAPQIELAMYFAVAEALTNAAKHAAASRISVRLGREPDRVVATVTDDGPGGADSRRGSGLRGMADRLAAVGGTLTIISPPGRGTKLIAEIPCAS